MKALQTKIGFLKFLRNIQILNLCHADEFIYWGHLGLGDQISSAKLFEHWSSSKRTVHVPCKSRNIENLSTIFGYLEGVRFHPISDDPKHEKKQVRELAKKLKLPIVNSGRECLTYMQNRFPSEGLNVALMRGAGLRTAGLFSQNFRTHVLSLPQITPPNGNYIFINQTTSKGVVDIPSVDEPSENRGEIVYPNPESRLYEHASLIDNAQELQSVGSAFMCLALVLGARPPIKKHFLRYPLLTDDPDCSWKAGNP